MAGKNFFVQAGGIEGAHQDIVEQLKGDDHNQVFSPEESDFLQDFLPTASRAITAALDNVPDNLNTTSTSYSYIKESNNVTINHNQTSSSDVNGAARGTQVEVTQERVVPSGSPQDTSPAGPPLAERQGRQLPGGPGPESTKEGSKDILKFAVATVGAVAVLGMLINKI